MLELYVSDAASEEKFPVEVRPASQHDFAETSSWQTNWTSAYAKQLPNKVALCRKDQRELLGLMSYALDAKGLAVEILMWKAPATATQTYCTRAMHKSDTLASPRLCLPMLHRYP